MFPAKSHAKRVAEELYKLIPDEMKSKRNVAFLQAAPVMYRHDTDRELPYHQEANFSYVTGCPTPNASVAILIPEGSIHLFIPAADPLETMWSVAPPTMQQAKDTFEHDDISYVSELVTTIKTFKKSGNVVMHLMPDTTQFPARPEAAFKDVSGIDLCDKYLLEAFHTARIIKDAAEVALIREANRISSRAHEVLMKELGRFAGKRAGSQAAGKTKTRDGGIGIQEWEVESEQDAEALFVATCRRAGAAQAYLPIVASGSHASTLHYVCNDTLFPSTVQPRVNGDTSFTPRQHGRGCCGSAEDHQHATPVSSHHDGGFEPQVLLIDAGCEWKDYASDITRTLPVGNGGRFTPRAAEIYDLVLRMQKECEALVKPGAHWDTIHLHGHKVLIDGFIQLGIFTGSPEAILASGVTAAFFPHGLGHSMGLDVHDSRQLLASVHLDLPVESKQVHKLFTYLRIRRKLEQGMVLTVEPGCYFPPQLMEEHGAWTSEYVNKDRLREYIGVGGVRLEDGVVVTADGCENLTAVPRERAEVEALCGANTV
ncbi:metallopeptidase family M24-domain-containing protein [Kockovaella imperatae]|uniref:Metallopeptidase family M24-domain-containing protein n=1 Tax=Kockovaella imperatae TaxID=4999 RepID=A0A1Y1UJS3_9TREE|nr:metallopeptidase family M24-domain-containing protein [Kockovaella imperatae]ORX37716.1 metallopeptidase family M24-domain-containing protein [Kockovaella imperatae]